MRGQRRWGAMHGSVIPPPQLPPPETNSLALSQRKGYKIERECACAEVREPARSVRVSRRDHREASYAHKNGLS